MYDQNYKIDKNNRVIKEKRDVNDVLLDIEHKISYRAKRAAEGYLCQGFPLEACAKSVGLRENELSRIKEILGLNGY